jgi:hypothetical protein
MHIGPIFRDRIDAGRKLAERVARSVHGPDRLVPGAWRTAPNHLRPASCVAEGDIDGEDHPERDPQKGH